MSVPHSASFAAEHMVDAEYTDTPSVSHFDAPSRLTEFERLLWEHHRNDQFFQDGMSTHEWYHDELGL